jgi:serine protease AprX
MPNRTKKNRTPATSSKRRNAVWGLCFLIAGLLLTVRMTVGLPWDLESPKISTESPKISHDLQQRRVNAEGDSPVDVIVQFTQHPTADHFDKVGRRGGTMKQDLSGVIKGAAFTVPASALADLANDPDVAYISPDRPVHSTAVELDYFPAAVYAPQAWQSGYNGTGVYVAVIDSGIIDIPDLHGQNNRVVYGQDFVTGGSAVDKYGHGSHVAGIIGGNGAQSSGQNFFYTFSGIAPTST